MAHDDELLEGRVRSAYEQVELSDEASERMLGNLLAARDAAGQAAEGVADEASQVDETPAVQEEAPAAEVLPFAPRRPRWQRWLPLAAALVAALVIVQATGVLQPSSNSAADMVAYSEEKSSTDAGGSSADAAATSGASPEEVVLEDTVDLSDEAPLAAGAVEESASADEAAGAVPMNAVDLYPRVELPDATVLTALEEGLYVREVEAADVGPKVSDAQAMAFDGGEPVACTVFELVGEPDAFAVRYEGEDTYWRCTKLE